MDRESFQLRGRVLQIIVKSFSALFVGVVASLVGRVFIGYETFGFVLVGVVFAGFFLKIFRHANLLKVIIFDLSFIFFLLLLDMYINLGPTI